MRTSVLVIALVIGCGTASAPPALDGSLDRALVIAADSNTVIASVTADDRQVIVHLHTDRDWMAMFAIEIATQKMVRLTPRWQGWSNSTVSPSSRHALVSVPQQGSAGSRVSDLYLVDLP